MDTQKHAARKQNVDVAGSYGHVTVRPKPDTTGVTVAMAGLKPRATVITVRLAAFAKATAPKKPDTTGTTRKRVSASVSASTVPLASEAGPSSCVRAMP